MARHVFQYDKMDTMPGPLTDPFHIPPLAPLPGDLESGGGEGGLGSNHHQPQADGTYRRPDRADVAGLDWVNNNPSPEDRRNTGAAHRQEDLARRQREQMLAMGPGGSSNGTYTGNGNTAASTPVVAVYTGAAPVADSAGNVAGVPIYASAMITNKNANMGSNISSQSGPTQRPLVFNADGSVANM